MKTLSSIKFFPAQGTATLYFDDSGFRSCADLTLSDLTPEQSAIVAGAMAWAQAKLPEGFARVMSVGISRLADVVTEWTQPTDPEATDFVPEPISTSPAFAAGVTGSGPSGERSIEIFSEPGDVAFSLAVLWGGLAQ